MDTPAPQVTSLSVHSGSVCQCSAGAKYHPSPPTRHSHQGGDGELAQDPRIQTAAWMGHCMSVSMSQTRNLLRRWWYYGDNIKGQFASSFNGQPFLMTGWGEGSYIVTGRPHGRKRSFFAPSSSSFFKEYLHPYGSTENDRKHCSSYSRHLGGTWHSPKEEEDMEHAH